MKTYREELTGAIKGNARLRSRLDEAKKRVAVLESHLKCMVTMLDSLGYGDVLAVQICAWSVGWRRDPEVARKCKEATK